MRRDLLGMCFRWLTGTNARGARSAFRRNRAAVSAEALETRVVLAAGDLDTTFNGTGTVTTPATAFGSDTGKAVAIQTDGKIVVVGDVPGGTNDINTSTDIAVIRYQANGSIDTSFGVNGVRYITIGTFDRALSVAIDVNGGVIVGGETNDSGGSTDIFLFRLTAAGVADTTFNGNGVIRYDLSNGFNDGVSSVIVEADRQVVIAGYTTIATGVGSQVRLAMLVQRYNADGTLDTTFGTNGSRVSIIGSDNDVATAITAIGDGRYLVTGNTVSNRVQYTFVTRVAESGVIDTSFGFSGGGASIISIGGTGIDYARSIAWMPIGRIVVGGYARVNATTGNHNVFAMRLDANGLFDTSFNSNGLSVIDLGSTEDEANALVVQRDGRIVLGGSVRAGVAGSFALVRWNVDGTLDSYFGNNGIRIYSYATDARMFGLALQADQKLVAVGWVGSNIAQRDFALARFLSDRVFPTGDASQIVRLYRAYNISADYHFFTTNTAEWQAAVTRGLRDESTGIPGIGVYGGPAAGSSPIYRLYNPNTGKHYYTLNLLERDNLQTIGWRYESIEGFMFDTQVANTTPIYRLYNTATGTHLYTHDLNVKNAILAAFPTWQEHTRFGYAYAWPLTFSTTAEAAALAAPVAVPAKTDEDQETAPPASNVALGLIAPLTAPAIASGPAELPATTNASSAPLSSPSNFAPNSTAAVDALFASDPWDWIG
jgi:uncharacterized delta-60 repeat protein